MELKKKERLLIFFFGFFKLSQIGLQIFATVESYFDPIEDGILFTVFLFNICLILENLFVFLCDWEHNSRPKKREKFLLIAFIIICLAIVAFYVYHYLVQPNEYNETHSYQEENGTTVTTVASTETISTYFSINNEETLAKKIKFCCLFEKNLSSTRETDGIIYTAAIITIQIILFIILRNLRKVHTLMDQESAFETRTDTQSLISIEETSSLSPEEIVNEERNTHNEYEEERKESDTEGFEILIPLEDDKL
ncbi:hypothetical protein Anas_04049 [Armadillidium nasatum]|uniref:Uncharacterized protein n=1 Tax=Armadillidium nasatum TaxID=96803 RepID=A0A5N5TLC6_9CRUS|nr:hypothetical protein Anas_04049 [Armadillidium nasatum]